jgi:putative ABC transport system permease protein
MSYHIRPILSALLRNRTGAVLVSLQIAIALAVLANSIYVVKQRWDIMHQPIGLDLDNMFTISTAGFTADFNHEAMIREDLSYLRSLDGVQAATATTHVPLGGTVWNSAFRPTASPTGPSGQGDLYMVDDQFIDALGGRLIAGRNFRPDEVLPPIPKYGNLGSFPPSVIVTKRFANDMFPNESPLGKVIYPRPDTPTTIIGVVETIPGGRVDLDYSGNVVFGPRLPSVGEAPSAFYVVRTKPGQLGRVLQAAETHLAKSNPNRVVDWVRPMSYWVARSFRGDRNMSIFLVTITGLLIVVTALGIFGLATFNVSTRTKQIGTRRALGARKQDIIRYFMVENWLVTTLGIVLGCVFALVAGYALTLQYGLPRLSLEYLLAGVLVLWIIGLAAAWKPARRAASISPATATRTV